VSTVGDELKISDGGKSRVIGISMKDRSAILPSGHMTDAAFWFEHKTGSFISSTYYFSELPAWASGKRQFTHRSGRPAYSGVQATRVYTRLSGALSGSSRQACFSIVCPRIRRQSGPVWAMRQCRGLFN
jgi:hypothetical protein